MEKSPLSRQTMCNRLAMEFQDGWLVNLGVGMPTLCANYDFGDKDITFHSENGVIGYGPLAREGEKDPHLVNASAQYCTLNPGAAIIHHADSFALIRGGYLDVTVLGAYEVADLGVGMATSPTGGRRAGREEASGGPWTWPWAPNESTSPWSTPPEKRSHGCSSAAPCPSQPSRS